MDEVTLIEMMREAPTSVGLFLVWWFGFGSRAWGRLVEQIRATSEGLASLADEVHAERVERRRDAKATDRRLRRLEVAAGLAPEDASGDFGDPDATPRRLGMRRGGE